MADLLRFEASGLDSGQARELQEFFTSLPEIAKAMTSALAKIAELEADLAERSRAFEDAVKVANDEISRRMQVEAERDEAVVQRDASRAVNAEFLTSAKRRPSTPPVRLPSGGKRLTVKRCCNGCNRELGDATDAEMDATVYGGGLPDVRVECGCAA